MIQRLTVMLVSVLTPLAAACDGSDASTSDSQPAITAVSDAVPAAASTSEPVEMADELRSAVEGSLDNFRGAVLIASGEHFDAQDHRWSQGGGVRLRPKPHTR